MIGTSMVRQIALAGLGLSALQLSACMQQPGGMSQMACLPHCATPALGGIYSSAVGGAYGVPSTTTLHSYGAIYQQPAIISMPQVIENHHTIPVSQYAVEPFASMNANGTHDYVTRTYGNNGHSYTTYNGAAHGSGAGMMSSMMTPMRGSTLYSNGSSAYGVTSDMVTLTQSDCPAGTTLQSNGTCLQGSSSMSSYGSSGFTTGSGSSTYTSSVGSSASTCPSGMVSTGNGICMSSSYTSSFSSGGQSSGSYTSSGTVATGCPAGTIAQSDGTCLQSSSMHSSSSHSMTTTSGYVPAPQKPGHYYRPVKK